MNISLSAETDVPTIGNLDSASQMNLGLETEKDNSIWYLVVTNGQDYENTNQRYYRFDVTAGGRKYEVELTIRNLDDESPYFLLPDSTPCEINVSNALKNYIP